MGLVFQSADLLPELNVLENVALVMLMEGQPRAEALSRASEALRQVGLNRHESKSPGQLSGGQGQRAAVARAIARPGIKVLIADEPTASLDKRNVQALAELIVEVTKQQGLATLVATHDDRVAALCDRTQQLEETGQREAE